MYFSIFCWLNSLHSLLIFSTSRILSPNSTLLRTQCSPPPHLFAQKISSLCFRLKPCLLNGYNQSQSGYELLSRKHLHAIVIVFAIPHASCVTYLRTLSIKIIPPTLPRPFAHALQPPFVSAFHKVARVQTNPNH